MSDEIREAIATALETAAAFGWPMEPPLPRCFCGDHPHREGIGPCRVCSCAGWVDPALVREGTEWVPGGRQAQ